jgi:hypothetical protein
MHGCNHEDGYGRSFVGHAVKHLQSFNIILYYVMLYYIIYYIIYYGIYTKY